MTQLKTSEWKTGNFFSNLFHTNQHHICCGTTSWSLQDQSWSFIINSSPIAAVVRTFPGVQFQPELPHNFFTVVWWVDRHPIKRSFFLSMSLSPCVSLFLFLCHSFALFLWMFFLSLARSLSRTFFLNGMVSHQEISFSEFHCTHHFLLTDSMEHGRATCTVWLEEP